MDSNFIKEVLEECGYTIISHKASEYDPGNVRYGEATKGMDKATWNEKGNYLRIRKDADTRTAFNGIVRNAQELRVLLEIVR